MITLHIAKLLSVNGFGVLSLTGSEDNAEIFWDSMPLDAKGNARDGIWIVTRSPEVNRFVTGIQNFDIYARYANKLTTGEKLENILEFLQQAYGEVCELPTVPGYSDTLYTNVRIEPTSGVDNVGSDEQEKIVKVISGIVRYSKA